MRKVLLVLTGVLNLLFGVFHVFLGYQIHSWIALSDHARGIMQACNIGCTLLVFFLAYVCLVRGKELMSTGLGGAVLGLGTLIYLSRGAEEFVLFEGNLAILGSCLAAGLLHLGLMLGVRMPARET